MTVIAQKKELVTVYIAQYKDIAIAEMQRTGVPAAITLAQGIHESGAGNSKLTLESNNHFGIKCKSNWTGESVKHDDDAKGECFRKYPLAEQSYKDHSDFLRNGQRYAFLFELDPTDYNGWANGLKKAGYATNPKYPEALIKLIEDYHLQDYTFIALGKTVPSNDAIVTVANKGNGNTGIVPAVEKTNTANQTITAPKERQYPHGEFKINDTKVIFIEKGTSYLLIAKQYDIDLSKIFEYNELREAEVAVNDQLVFLQRKKKTGENDTHTVSPGETLYSISQTEAIRIEHLLELNGLKPGDQPATGETLNLKVKSSKPPMLISSRSTINQ